MAVNNFAPAEFGGYVLGVNGSGGGDGGGLSEFDEFVGATSFANVTMNMVFPEGTEDTQITSLYLKAAFGTVDEFDNFTYHFEYTVNILNPDNPVVIPIPISEDFTTTVIYLADMSVDTSSGFYLFNSNDISFSGNVERLNSSYISVSGDGVITVGLMSD